MTQPKGWTEVSLDEVATSELGKMLDKAKRTSGTPQPYLRNQNVRWDGFDLEDVYEMPFESHELERFGLRNGDLLVCEGGEPGRAAVWTGGAHMMFQKALHRVRPGEALDARYLLFRLMLDASTGRLNEYFTGTTIKHLTGVSLGRYRFPLPPWNEQRRIVAKLDAIFEQTRVAKARLERLPPLLDDLKRSILAAVFRGDLTADWRAAHPNVEPASVLLDRIRSAHRQRWAEELRGKGRDPSKAKHDEPADVNTADLPALPPGWTWAPAELVVEPGTVITYGIVLPGKHVADGIPYIRQQDIQDGDVRVDELLRTAPEIAAKYERSSLREGDVLLCIIRHRRVAIVPPGIDGANITQGTVRLRPSRWMRGPFLAAWLDSPVAQRWMEGRVFGLDMPRINVGDARQVPVPVPPLGEQERIIELIHEVRARWDALVSASRTAAKLAEQLERAALAKAFRGELVEQDPGDEPASVLLERLRLMRNDQHHTPDGKTLTRVLAERGQKKSRAAGTRPRRTEGSKSVER